MHKNTIKYEHNRCKRYERYERGEEDFKKRRRSLEKEQRGKKR